MGLPISGVAEDGEDFDSSHVPTAKFVQELRLIMDLQARRENTNTEPFMDNMYSICVHPLVFEQLQLFCLNHNNGLERQ